MNHNKHKSEESVQDYLETIYVLNKSLPQVRSIDIANHLGYSKPSVSTAMSKLEKAECIERDADGQLHLTEKGRAVAEYTLSKHRFFKNFLMEIGVSEETAEQDACRLEHSISSESYEKLREWYNKSQNK